MLIQQVLAGIRFIWSRKLDHQLISVRNIRLSQSVNFKKTLDERERELVAIKAADEMKSFMEQEWAKIRGIVEDSKRQALSRGQVGPTSDQALETVSGEYIFPKVGSSLMGC